MKLEQKHSYLFIRFRSKNVTSKDVCAKKWKYVKSIWFFPLSNVCDFFELFESIFTGSMSYLSGALDLNGILYFTWGFWEILVHEFFVKKCGLKGCVDLGQICSLCQRNLKLFEHHSKGKCWRGTGEDMKIILYQVWLWNEILQGRYSYLYCDMLRKKISSKSYLR